MLGDGTNNNEDATRTDRPNYRTQQQRRAQTTSGDFEVSLLILASVVIKADGVQDQRELDFVRKQFVSMYGKDRANKAFKLFKNISKQNVPYVKYVYKYNK